MEEETLPLSEYLAILKRRKWQLIIPAVLLSMAAVIVAVTIPAVYRSSATILIERQEIPPDLVRSTVTSYADQRVQVISQRVLTTRNLTPIIKKYDLYPELRRKVSINAAVDKMRKAVGLNMISADVVDPQSGSAKKATIAFSLSFDSPSPVLAQKVTNNIVSLFLDENLRQRRAAVDETTAFLQEEAKKLGDQVSTIEARLARFKEEHADNLPESIPLTREFIDRTEGHLQQNDQAARTLQGQKVLLESQLAQLNPYLEVAGPSGSGVPALSPEAQLRRLEASYPSIVARYSPKHPDRLRVEREMAVLRKQVARDDVSELKQKLGELKGELTRLRKRYSEKHPDVKRVEAAIVAAKKQLAAVKRGGGGPERPAAETPNNPAYVQVQTQLESTKVELDSLRKARTELQATLASFEKRLTEGPKIEQEYRALTRDYDNAMSKYKEVRSKTMQAQLAQSLEAERKGERFSVIEPALVPDKPEKPNRPAILLLGIVLSFGGGAGNLVLFEVMDKGVRTPRAVQAVTRAPPLAVIPYIETQADRHQRARKRKVVAAGAVAAVLVAVAAVHLFLIPLDELWVKLLNRIGSLASAAVPLPFLPGARWNV